MATSDMGILIQVVRNILKYFQKGEVSTVWLVSKF